MIEPLAGKGIGADRAVARVLQAAAVAPTPATTEQRTPGADVSAVSGVASQLAAKPPVDGERVAQIKKAIANGTFPILPATIADRLLAVRYEWMNNDAS